MINIIAWSASFGVWATKSVIGISKDEDIIFDILVAVFSMFMVVVFLVLSYK